MTDSTLVFLIAGLLFPVTLIAMEVGRRLGLRRMAKDPEGVRAGTGVVESAVFALFGLLIAFTFTSAASRYETRRELIVQHTNAIGTAWLRLDLLPAELQPVLRKDFRLYVDEIIKVHQHAGDRKAVKQTMANLGKLQDEIWKLAETAVSWDSRPQVATLALPALNEMFDLTASRYAAARFHVSMVIFWFLIFLSLLASLLAGYAMASAKLRNWLHMILFALLISLTLYVIFDFEYPRRGIIQLSNADHMYIELRKTMQ
jgi:ABC-type glycerol-3-phosphate transport system permease component